MYVLDKNVFIILGHYYTKRFPRVWEKIDNIVVEGKLWSVREVRKELEVHCPFSHIEEWVAKNKDIFKKPTEDELYIVSEIFKRPHLRGFVKRSNLLKGLPVADPFIVAAAKINGTYVVTEEKYAKGGARIPTACEEFGIDCINTEQFLEKENIGN